MAAAPSSGLPLSVQTEEAAGGDTLRNWERRLVGFATAVMEVQSRALHGKPSRKLFLETTRTSKPKAEEASNKTVEPPGRAWQSVGWT
jgi:hypothetical protein